MGRPKSRPRRQFPPSKAKAQQTCYTALMNLTQCPPINPMTPNMSTCSDKKPAQSPPAAPPTACAAGTGKKSANASHGAPTPPRATAAAKNATAAAKPAPPAAQQKTGAANAHLSLPSQNPSHKLCRKHQNAPFSQKLRAFFKKNRRKTSPSLSCHERSHQCPVTRKKNSRQNLTPFDLFSVHPIPYRYPSCLPTAACDGRNRKPSGPSWAKPAPPSPRAAAPPPRSCSSSTTTVWRGDMLHCAAWPQFRFSALGPLDSPALGWTRRIITNSLTVKLTGVHPISGATTVAGFGFQCSFPKVVGNSPPFWDAPLSSGALQCHFWRDIIPQMIQAGLARLQQISVPPKIVSVKSVHLTRDRAGNHWSAGGPRSHAIHIVEVAECQLKYDGYRRAVTGCERK